MGMPSDITASSTSSTGVPCSTALMITRVMRVSTRLTTNPGASLTRIGRLRSFSPTSHTVASVTSSVSAARTTSSRGISATGLKKCMPASRSGRRSSAAMSRDRERRGVRREHALVAHDALELGEDLLLHLELLEHRLEHEVAVREAVVVGAAGDERRQEPRLAFVVPAFRGLAADLRADVGERLVDDLLLHVAQHGRHFEPAQEQRRDLPRHQPCADDADAVHLQRCRERARGMLLRSLLDEPEGIDRRLRLRPRQELADRLSFTRVALFDRPLLRALDQVERRVGRRRGAVHRVVDARARSPKQRFGIRPVRICAFERPVCELTRERERLVHELHCVEQPVGDP